MTHQEAWDAFMKAHWRGMSQREFGLMTEYKENHMSISGLWSYRGAIWKKYAGSMPTPEEVGLPSGHAFFDPDVVCTCRSSFSNGRPDKVEHYHRGRKLKPTHRLFPRNPT